jgi:hypothetical protein
MEESGVESVLASGTNDFHGDAFEILRNQLFDSAGFFPTRFSPSGTPEPPINQQNNYGFTVGGPVWIPKVYNGRNRTFFHFSADWFRQNQAQNFPGNKIPQQRFSALSQSLLSQIPDPDTAGVNGGLLSNKLPAIHSIPIRQTLWDYTIDENLTASQNIHFSQWHDSVNSPFFTSAPIVQSSNPLQSQVTNENVGNGLVLNYAYTISPRLVVTAGVDAIGNVIGQHNANNNVN